VEQIKYFLTFHVEYLTKDAKLKSSNSRPHDADKPRWTGKAEFRRLMFHVKQLVAWSDSN
jgi:hypothetical protein